ncbi:MAG: DUF2071 domain-containing protein, partial [Rhodospirillales bacterium]|nr:DUF2071 domain-containing protein [Acetobacter sp.]
LYGEAYSTAETAHLWGLRGAQIGSKPPQGGRRRARRHFRQLAEAQPTQSVEAIAYRSPQVQVEYEWVHKGTWQRLGVRGENRLLPILPGSLEEFITEHYWGYAHRRSGGTTEYAVEHQRWKVYPVSEHRIVCDFGSLYGREFEDLTSRTPDHVLLAEGAPVAIRWGGRITRS